MHGSREKPLERFEVFPLVGKQQGKRAFFCMEIFAIKLVEAVVFRNRLW